MSHRNSENPTIETSPWIRFLLTDLLPRTLARPDLQTEGGVRTPRQVVVEEDKGKDLSQHVVAQAACAAAGAGGI